MTARATMPAEEAPESSKPRRIDEDHTNDPGRPTHHVSSANESGRTVPPWGRPGYQCTELE